jgi:hypothetical protein
MEDIEIGDVAMAYDDPILLRTYLVDTNDGSQLASSVSNQRGIAFH